MIILPNQLMVNLSHLSQKKPLNFLFKIIAKFNNFGFEGCRMDKTVN